MGFCGRSDSGARAESSAEEWRRAKRAGLCKTAVAGETSSGRSKIPRALPDEGEWAES